ncbi:hypothetical protein ACSSS7_003091 [Eimeria intestinalis]
MEGPPAEGPPSGQGPRPSALKLSGLPPLDCCILYGSSYYRQRPAREKGAPPPEEPHAAINQVGPPNGQEPQGSLKTPLNDLLLLVPQQRLLQWHTSNLTRHGTHYGPLIRWVSALGGPPKGASFAARLTQTSGVPMRLLLATRYTYIPRAEAAAAVAAATATAAAVAVTAAAATAADGATASAGVTAFAPALIATAPTSAAATVASADAPATAAATSPAIAATPLLFLLLLRIRDYASTAKGPARVLKGLLQRCCGLAAVALPAAPVAVALPAVAVGAVGVALPPAAVVVADAAACVSGLRLALLLLPEEVSLKRLLEEIVSLSYKGDVRMLVAEDPDKVSAIVRGQSADLCAIYLPLLKTIPSAHLELSGGALNGGPAGGAPQGVPHGGPQGGLPPQQERLRVLELLKEKTEKRMQQEEAAAVAEAVETGALRIRVRHLLSSAAAGVAAGAGVASVVNPTKICCCCCCCIIQRSLAALSALYAPLPASFRSISEAPMNSLHLLLLLLSAAAASPVKRVFSFFTVKPTEGPPRGPLGGPLVGPHDGPAMGTLAPPATPNLERGLRQLIFWPALKCSFKNAVAAGVSTSVAYGLRKVQYAKTACVGCLYCSAKANKVASGRRPLITPAAAAGPAAAASPAGGSSSSSSSRVCPCLGLELFFQNLTFDLKIS